MGLTRWQISYGSAGGGARVHREQRKSEEQERTERVCERERGGRGRKRERETSKCCLAGPGIFSGLRVVNHSRTFAHSRSTFFFFFIQMFGCSNRKLEKTRMGRRRSSGGLSITSGRSATVTRCSFHKPQDCNLLPGKSVTQRWFVLSWPFQHS